MTIFEITFHANKPISAKGHCYYTRNAPLTARPRSMPRLLKIIWSAKKNGDDDNHHPSNDIIPSTRLNSTQYYASHTTPHVSFQLINIHITRVTMANATPKRGNNTRMCCNIWSRPYSTTVCVLDNFIHSLLAFCYIGWSENLSYRHRLPIVLRALSDDASGNVFNKRRKPLHWRSHYGQEDSSIRSDRQRQKPRDPYVPSPLMLKTLINKF